ncbi:hypothetical protein IQ265_12735 [Nodosilinea sp. LEGE 06152]|uniref:hypothetical protein n=1 Tax=Nodosilinea sp. LEGE 06152 TaxID=2777966 RepID=UPI00187FA76F|nr:hypothetical protein [Nodosilinea sp. LEGE 06152]MBE9157685.1 hypothetical protein [Nodosilinea sp. LEGE 06152]
MGAPETTAQAAAPKTKTKNAADITAATKPTPISTRSNQSITSMPPDCPNIVPSLDHPTGWYCAASCGGNCHKGTDSSTTAEKFKEHARPAPPKPFPGSTIDYLGAKMTVYHSGTTDDSIWLMPPGSTTALVYQWPPIAPDFDSSFDSVSDSANPRGFSDSEIEEGAIAPFSDSSFDSVSDSARFRTVGKIWQECGPYPSKGYTYYRYRWGKGDRIEGVRHIPGGALTRLVVANRAYRVHQAVHVEGRSHAEVLAMIDSWRAGKKYAH